MSSSDARKALVIGGGIAGLAACVALRKRDKAVAILLVEPKEYFEVPWAAYRNIFDCKMAEESIFDLLPWLVKHNVTHIATTVTKLTESVATLGNGEVIDDFSVAIVCVGAVCKWPSLGRCPAIPVAPVSSTKKKEPSRPKGNALTRDERLLQLRNDGSRLLDAGSVLVVGGGLIGVETAGDLAYFAKKQGKDLEVTLVHSGESLVPEFPRRASNLTFAKLTKLGVKVILGDKVVPSAKKVTGKKQSKSGPTTTFLLQTANQEVHANHVVWTTGVTSQNLAFLDSKYLTTKGGWIKVDETFRISNCESGRLFAFGDCCDLLPNAAVQVLDAMPVIGHNLKAILDSSTNSDGEVVARTRKLKKALVQPEVYICTIGKRDGVALTPLGVTGLLLPKLKNKTQFLMKPKSALALS